MARVSFGGGKGRPMPAPIRRSGGRAPRPLPPQKKWYEDPGLLLGWVRLAETLAAPKGLVARGIRAAERYQKSGAIEDARAAQEADAVIVSLHERSQAGDVEAQTALDPMGEWAQQEQFRHEYPQGDVVSAGEPLPGGAEPSVFLPTSTVGAPAAAAPPAAAPREGGPSRVPFHTPSTTRTERSGTAGFGPIDAVNWYETGQPNTDGTGGNRPSDPTTIYENMGETYPAVLEARIRNQKTGGGAKARAIAALEEIAPLRGDAPPAQTPAAEPAPTPAPGAQPVAGEGFRPHTLARQERGRARAAEIKDFGEVAGIHTVADAMEKFSQYAEEKMEGGKLLSPSDFADLYAQAREAMENDPAFVDAIWDNPMKARREMRKELMAFFKFLGMGGDRAAAMRVARKKETKVDLQIAKMQAEAAERDKKAARNALPRPPSGVSATEFENKYLAEFEVPIEDRSDKVVDGVTITYKTDPRAATAQITAIMPLKTSNRWKALTRKVSAIRSASVRVGGPPVSDLSWDPATSRVSWMKGQGGSARETFGDVAFALDQGWSAQELTALGVPEADILAAQELAAAPKPRSAKQSTIKAAAVLQPYVGKTITKHNLETLKLWGGVTGGARQKFVDAARHLDAAATAGDTVPQDALVTARALLALEIAGW